VHRCLRGVDVGLLHCRVTTATVSMYVPRSPFGLAMRCMRRPGVVRVRNKDRHDWFELYDTLTVARDTRKGVSLLLVAVDAYVTLNVTARLAVRQHIQQRCLQQRKECRVVSTSWCGGPLMSAASWSITLRQTKLPDTRCAFELHSRDGRQEAPHLASASLAHEGSEHVRAEGTRDVLQMMEKRSN
jgi:hypothetical protein